MSKRLAAKRRPLACEEPAAPPKEPFHGLEHPVRREVAGDRDDEVARRVAGAVVAVEVLAADRSHGLRRAENGRAERVALPERAHEHFVDEVVRVVVGLPNLLEDDAPFGLDVGRSEGRREDDVSHEIESLRKAGLLGVAVEAGVLPGREGVDVAPEPVDLLCDPRVGPAARALEEQVLEEV